MTYFWLGPAIVLFLYPVGHAVVDSHANELSPAIANFTERDRVREEAQEADAERKRQI